MHRATRTRQHDFRDGRTLPLPHALSLLEPPAAALRGHRSHGNRSRRQRIADSSSPCAPAVKVQRVTRAHCRRACVRFRRQPHGESMPTICGYLRHRILARIPHLTCCWVCCRDGLDCLWLCIICICSRIVTCGPRPDQPIAPQPVCIAVCPSPVSSALALLAPPMALLLLSTWPMLQAPLPCPMDTRGLWPGRPAAAPASALLKAPAPVLAPMRCCICCWWWCRCCMCCICCMCCCWWCCCIVCCRFCIMLATMACTPCGLPRPRARPASWVMGPAPRGPTPPAPCQPHCMPPPPPMPPCRPVPKPPCIPPAAGQNAVGARPLSAGLRTATSRVPVSQVWGRCGPFCSGRFEIVFTARTRESSHPGSQVEGSRTGPQGGPSGPPPPSGAVPRQGRHGCAESTPPWNALICRRVRPPRP